MKEYIVKYSINYASGKKWFDSKKVYSVSPLGAEDVIKWIFSSRDISIISITPTGKKSPLAVYGDDFTVGER